MMVTRGKSKKFSITKSIHEVVVKPKEIPTSRRILVATHSFSFSLPPQPLHCSGGRFFSMPTTVEFHYAGSAKIVL